MEACKKIFKATLPALIVLMLISGTVLAAYSYYTTIQVQETGGNSYTYLPVIADIDNDYSADNGYMNLTGLDTRILSGSTELAHMVADDKVLFAIPAIGANSTGNYRYTLGNSLLSDFPVIIGYNGYVTTAHHANLELAASFVLDKDGYIPTTLGYGTLVQKRDAFTTYIDGADVTSAVLGVATWTSPTGFADPDAEWANEAQIYDEDTGTGATEANVPATSWSSYVYLTRASTDIDSVRFFAVQNVGADEIDIDVSINGTDWIDVYEGTYASAAWVTKYTAGVIANVTQARVRIYNSQGAPQDVFLREFDFGALNVTASATAAAVSNGSHTVKTTYDGADLVIIVDEGEAGEISDTTPWVGVVPNVPGSAWLFMHNIAYLDYYSHTTAIGGVSEKIRYEPDSIIVGTTLPNENNPGTYDGTITWGSNPADISITIGSLISSSQPEVSPASEEEAPDIVPEGNVPVSGGVVDTTKLEDNPLYPIVEIISEYTDYTEEQIWFFGATLIILIGMGIAVVKVPNHLLLAGTVGLVLAGFFMAMSIYQWWMMLIFGFMFIVSILMERKPVL